MVHFTNWTQLNSVENNNIDNNNETKINCKTKNTKMIFAWSI